ncbi:MAG TPA: sulfatase-like hydrolase/transferase [Casimicrobiaceae bacterium]|nr:sulfatase-like hydrolase/transferase [Casimicrobiaceae bacterium]
MSAQVAGGSGRSDKPHILIIMTDQQRADCLSCAGHPQIRTPHLDRIAREGTRFAQVVTVAPLCMPARISFATALYPHDHGVWGNAGSLAESDATLFQALQREGYSTALVGKAHYYEQHRGMDLREREAYMRERGFEHVHEVPGPFGSGLTTSYLSDEWQRKGVWDQVREDLASRAAAGDWVVRPSPLAVDDHLDSYVGRRAVEFVDAYRDERPMCLFVGFPGPHEPWDAPGSYATMYAPEETPPPIPVPPFNGKLSSRVRRKAAFEAFSAQQLSLIPQIRANYYGKISLIDEHVGRLLAALERRSMLDGSIVVFLADHGEMLGDHGRIRKGTFHESAVRIPLLMRWPGRIEAGAVSDALVESIDILPTLLEAAGCTPASRCAGRSLWPLLQSHGNGELREAQLSEVEHHRENQTMLRTRRHKLALDGVSRTFMLYDLERDPLEQHNLAGDPDASELESRLRQLLRSRIERSSLPAARAISATRAG